ncbi:MAG: DUF4271 domain-containing protein [Chitinophagaceae bacterium]
MNRSLLFLAANLFLAVAVIAQTPADTTRLEQPDSLLQRDSVITTQSLAQPVFVFNKDSVSKRPRQDSGWTMVTVPTNPQEIGWQVTQHNPWFGFNAKPVYPPKSQLRQFSGKELLFYLLIFLLIVFALLRQAFPKYFNDLFRLFFRTTIKQRQIREQLMQTPLPSLMLNGFFVVSAGLYIAFMFRHFGVRSVDNFWLLAFYCCAGLSVAYLVKFVGLKVSGWVFNMPEAADSYIFIVFIVNKMIGIMLLPFLVLLAFTLGNIYSVSLTLSWCIVGGLLLYRFILSFVAIRNQVRVNPFHFFLWLCAFEIAPLLLVYKGLIEFFNLSA